MIDVVHYVCFQLRPAWNQYFRTEIFHLFREFLPINKFKISVLKYCYQEGLSLKSPLQTYFIVFELTLIQEFYISCYNITNGPRWYCQLGGCFLFRLFYCYHFFERETCILFNLSLNKGNIFSKKVVVIKKYKKKGQLATLVPRIFTIIQPFLHVLPSFPGITISKESVQPTCYSS